MNFKQNKEQEEDLHHWIRMMEGREIAFNFLMKKYFNFLLNYGYKFVKDEDFVKDCVQEVFIEIWKRKERLSQPVSVKAYLLSSVRKKVVRENFRQNALKEELDAENSTSLADFSIEWAIMQQENEHEINEKINRTLATLPKRQREVLYLQFYQNLSRDEIAETMDINAQSVSNLLQSAFKSFKEYWKTISVLLLWFQIC